MPNAREQFTEILATFTEEIRSNFSLDTIVHANPEDQLKSPIQELIRKTGELLQLENTQSRTEIHVDDLKGRPDIAFLIKGLLCGYLELKAPGKGANTSRYRGSDKEQWKKFKALPNVIYTDGSEWALYRNGTRINQIISFSGDITESGEHAYTEEQSHRLFDLLTDFLNWDPIVPSSPKALAEILAPLCHLLRDEVLVAVHDANSCLSQLSNEWHDYFFPNADISQFADAYAQTVTYALLLAHITNEESELHTYTATHILEHKHSLIAQILSILTNPDARNEILLGVELLERCISAVEPTRFSSCRRDDPWLYFYEDFLAEYDPKLRKDRGVYYTPYQVVNAQVNLVSELLVEKFHKSLSYASDDVVFLDPASGTGTYPLMMLDHTLNLIRDRYGSGAVSGKATDLASRIYGFEILVGPYAVSHLRLSQKIYEVEGQLPEDGPQIFLTDTLENPFQEPSGQQHLTITYKRLAEQHAKAQHVKSEVPVMVCMGNPPYDRQTIELDDQDTERKGGWVRYGDGESPRTLLDDFLDSLSSNNEGIHAKNLYNDYVYFWRWALWKIFESQSGPGVISFITASSYLRGPGFKGMREYMRRTFDNIWIIDLEGDNRGARKTENVFNIETPVAIAIGCRSKNSHVNEPATTFYTKLTGTRAEKLSFLKEISSFTDLNWQECFNTWDDPFLPTSSGNYFIWPLVTDLFPWQHSGVQFKRTWTIGEDKEVLIQRWQALLSGGSLERPSLLRETRDRKVNKSYLTIESSPSQLPPISTLSCNEPHQPIVRYGYRSFDRQWIIFDPRLCDFPKKVLWELSSSEQIFMTSLLTKVLGIGPAVSVSAFVPDMDYFCNRGGKDVIPLWLDKEGIEPNLKNGLLSFLSFQFGKNISPEEFFSYCYAILFSPSYVDMFSEELAVPGPRLPITKNPNLFEKFSNYGKKLIWLQTYGERFIPEDFRYGEIPVGNARCIRAIPPTREGYPDTFSFDEETRTLHVGQGEFAPVSKQIWEFSISGLKVLQSWLSYRMKSGSGRKSSPLDYIRPEIWTSTFTEELLELIWVLEATFDILPNLNSDFEELISGPIFTEEEIEQTVQLSLIL